MSELVIGGAGFIGSNLCDRLLASGKEVVVLDNFSRKGTRRNFQCLESRHPDSGLIEADIRNDQQELEEAVAGARNIYHLAAQVAVTTSVADPRLDFEVNALGTFNVLEAVRKANPHAFLIFSSTNKVYGALEHEPVAVKGKRYEFRHLKKGVSEKMNLDFHSPYGCSKGIADQYVRDYSRIYGLNTVVFRQSCIYGPRQFGVEDQGWAAWFTIATLLGRKITIYGNGKQVRDLLHSDDLIDVFMLAVKNRRKASGKIYNIGGGNANSLSLLEFLEMLGKELGRKIPLTFSDVRPGDQPIYISDNSLAYKELGWKPKTSVGKGIRQLIGWVKSNESEIRDVLE